ncbi:MAG: thermonuclease family protein [Candidatus Staskawiczbacteria bacterium]|nr:thermonuclease family protein [Candidatus Staskawiczbacteria bacterium]
MENLFERNKIFLGIIIGAIIIGGCVYFGLQNSQVAVAPNDYSNVLKNNGIAENTGACGASDNTIITKVIDGDTVVVEGGFHVRLLGMDADEKGYPCYEPAKNRLENLVLLKQVRLEKDKTDLDQYGRCLRYIFLGNTNIDVQLVKEGLAIARFYPPDIKYKAEITEAEKSAQENKVGCKWSE